MEQGMPLQKDSPTEAVCGWGTEDSAWHIRESKSVCTRACERKRVAGLVQSICAISQGRGSLSEYQLHKNTQRIENISDELCVTIRLSKNVFRHVYTAQTHIHTVGKYQRMIIMFINNHCMCHTDLAVYISKYYYTQVCDNSLQCLHVPPFSGNVEKPLESLNYNIKRE